MLGLSYTNSLVMLQHYGKEKIRVWNPADDPWTRTDWTGILGCPQWLISQVLPRSPSPAPNSLIWHGKRCSRYTVICIQRPVGSCHWWGNFSGVIILAGCGYVPSRNRRSQASNWPFVIFSSLKANGGNFSGWGTWYIKVRIDGCLRLSDRFSEEEYPPYPRTRKGKVEDTKLDLFNVFTKHNQ